MVLWFEYLSSRNGKVVAVVAAEVRTTPKRIIITKQVSQIKYKTQPGTKNALYLKCPKMFDRATGKPIPNPSVSRGWWPAFGEVERLERAVAMTIPPQPGELVCQPS
jgi:hypothetical protein